MKVFENAKWIWPQKSLATDDYAEFVFEVSNIQDAVLRISADSNYAVYVNDDLIKFMGNGDFPFYKYFDEIKLCLSKKKNLIKINVWHIGYPSSCYFVAEHGLIFELVSNNKVILSSSEDINSRVMNEFSNGRNKVITVQQGLTFKFDNSIKKTQFSKSQIIKKECNFVKRNISDLILGDRPDSKIVKSDKKSILVDLGKDFAGLLDLYIISDEKQDLLIAFGEHIVDGGVRRIIGERDFSLEFVTKKGKNHFINPLKRIAARYLEIFFNKKVEINYAGIRPVIYNHEVIRKDYHDELVNKINDVCIDTLELCMHEHYEDCPWREQCLYILDSLNQMMAGFKVFKGYEYARHNIETISQSLNKDGYLAICAPSANLDFVIPFFNLMFVKEVYEYIKATNDKSILNVTEKPIKLIINNFVNRLDKNHLVKFFEAPKYWNFYEWCQESDNADVFDGSYTSKEQYDLIMNAAFVYATNYYNELFEEKIDVTSTKEAIMKTFYDEERKVFVLNTNTKSYSQLGNAFACLIGLGNEKLLEKIKTDKNMIKASLATRNFVYDALLKNNKNQKFVLDDIKITYKAMLDQGATSFWETEEGESAFENAGSLCHGWSAIPAYYFAELLK